MMLDKKALLILGKTAITATMVVGAIAIIVDQYQIIQQQKKRIKFYEKTIHMMRAVMVAKTAGDLQAVYDHIIENTPIPNDLRDL